MKDLADPKDKESQVAVGDGVMPIRKMFEALVAIKYRASWIWNMRSIADDPMPGVIRASRICEACWMAWDIPRRS